VAYERGKVPIPESDLWVLAGSCGVDVAELVPSTTSRELVVAGEPATTIGDTVAQLRRNQADPGVTPYLGTLHKLLALPPGKRIPVKERELDAISVALGATPATVERKLQDVLHISPDEAERLRAMIVAPPGGRGKRKAIAASSAPEPVAPPALPSTPALAEPGLAEPTFDEPTFDEPTFDEPTFDEPTFDEPTFDEPTFDEPAFASATLTGPAAFFDAPLDAMTGHNVDVFEELARLPEPLPLGEPGAPLPDLLAPPTGTFADDPFVTASSFMATTSGAPLGGPPEGAVELVDAGSDALSSESPAFEVAADAPPIDVAMRQGSDRWDLGEAPLEQRVTPEPDTTWETGGWQPPEPPAGDVGAPPAFWEGTDDWAPTEPDVASVDTVEPLDETAEHAAEDSAEATEPEILDSGTETHWAPTWDAPTWTIAEPLEPVEACAEVDPWVADEWPRELSDEGPWEHQPDPEAVSTGFFVDWGTPETALPQPAAIEPAVPAWDAEPAHAWDAEPAPVWDPVWAETETPDDVEDLDATVVDVDVDDVEIEHVEIEAEDVALEIEHHVDIDHIEHVDVEVEHVEVEDVEIDELPPISWRADGPPALPAPEVVELQPTEDETEATFEFEPEPETFVSAGSDWVLGNALPLVEVQAKGALVMRRADERWALADVTTTADFAVEVDVDFRSGPGLGVLFRASIDEQGRMSGYSFDIDPIYDGGGYLVRQWLADRELWNPIARVGAPEPTTMYGSLTVRLVVTGDHLVALVNGLEVLTVENLKQASADRGREAADGDRVGVQAWSSSDLVIDTLRVAEH